METELSKKLYEAYADLVKKPDKDITVTLLCTKANVARASFYLYYKDLDDFRSHALQSIIHKMFQLIRTVLTAEDAQLQTALKKENLLFREADLILLHHFTDGTNYISFLQEANGSLLPAYQQLARETFGSDHFARHEQLFTFYLCGMLPMLYFNLLNFDSKTMLTEMMQVRKIGRDLFKDFIPDTADKQ